MPATLKIITGQTESVEQRHVHGPGRIRRVHQHAPAAPGPFLGHGLQVLLAPPLRLGPLVGPGGVSEGLSGRVRHHTRGQLHTGRRDAARHLLGVELELEADQRTAPAARSLLLELLVGNQVEQWPQLVLNRLLDALRAMIGRLSDQAQGILTAVKRRQRPSGAPQAPSSPEPAERPQERPQARETPPQAPQEPPKPIRTKKALTDRFKTRLDERLAENERKQAEKQAEPDMEETWDLSDPADPLNIGMGWGTGGHGLGL